MTKSDSNTLGLTSNLDTEVGKVVVETGLASPDEVKFCRELQKQSSDPNQRSLADILIENNVITVNQAKRLRAQVEGERRTNKIPGYRILDVLGKGAMAKVYRAEQLSLNRMVAVKVLPWKMSDNAEFVERFYKEGRAAAQLSHNNIVQAIELGMTPDGRHYFVMEYIEGKTLYDMMQPPPVGEGRNFSEASALDIMIQIAEALNHAHRRGLIHRDVKPKNIILTPQGVAKLTDLGLARAIDDKQAAESEAGKAYGTPYYISPEQIRGEVNIDHRADIYSLGATMYHMVTGAPPFDGETPSAVMHKHLKQPLIPADHVNTALSAGVGEIIEVAMAKNREERYSTMQDMLEDLRAVRAGDPPIHARRAVDIESLERVEQTARTVDIDPVSTQSSASPWGTPVGIVALISISASVLLNLVLLLLWLSK